MKNQRKCLLRDASKTITMREGKAMNENEVTKKIEKLETENRMLTAALKSRDAPPMRAEMDLGPVFDARSDLTTLTEILGAALYLSGHDDDDEEPWKADVITALVAVQEKIAECAEGLNGAIEGMKILDRSGATKSAPAAVSAAAGA